MVSLAIIMVAMFLIPIINVPASVSAWSGDPTENTAICTAAGGQTDPQLISDGVGGAIVIWIDNRSGNYDIYAQRVNSSGAVQWIANGSAICIAAGGQENPQLTSDGVGGAIVTWKDNRSGNYDIYAQRVNSSGFVQWTANGIAICTTSGAQDNSQLISDGVGGVIITWEDNRSGNYDIYAQRVNSSGAVQWAANGSAICTAASAQYSPQIISDGSGGDIITWYDYRSGTGSDIYAQRVNSSGAAQWIANGSAICTAASAQEDPQLISDGVGGAIITWADRRGGSGSSDIYAQRVNSSGAAKWAANGSAICTAASAQYSPQIISDGSGGDIITWYDYRGGSGSSDIYAQRVNSSGAAKWAANGSAICTDASDQYGPQLISDGVGGAIIIWSDYRSGNYDIYAQGVNPNGSLAIPTPTNIITLDLPSDWASKQLFTPIFQRSNDKPNTVVLGVHNKRDMWYKVNVSIKQAGQTSWNDYYPSEWSEHSLSYLAPWGEKTFSYTPNPGDEIKIEVSNDLNDGTLCALYTLDFALRSLLGISIAPSVTDLEEFCTELLTFYNEYLNIGVLFLTQHPDQAMLKLGQKMATVDLQVLLKEMGIDIGINLEDVAGLAVGCIANVPKWTDLIANANKEPFIEDIIYTAKQITPLETPNLMVTKSLRIVEPGPYYSGETVTAQFTVVNIGTTPVILNHIAAGGRGPQGDTDVHDFTLNTDITLNTGDSYDYQGKLALINTGAYHFFVAYQTADGQWSTSVPMVEGSTNTLDISVNPIPDQWIAAKLCSPGELRVYDSSGRVSGLVDGQSENEIPHSICAGDVVIILDTNDSYTFHVVGTGNGTYGLQLASNNGGVVYTFAVTDMPTSLNASHQYTVDWDAIVNGEQGVTARIDSDGDGIYEETLYAPIAEAEGPYTGIVGSPITFNASGSYDPDGNITLYEWDFDNDGIYEYNSSLPTATHTWSAAYAGNISLKVTDSDNLSITDMAEVIVTGEIVTFPDLGLDSVIRAAINKSSGDIYQSDLDTLTTLEASSRNISDLTGIEHCINLTDLSLSDNQISNIASLSSLINLGSLYLSYNNISDISALSGLTNLTGLSLYYNQIISNISALSGLINLKTLSLASNQISNISALSELTKLIELYFSDNQISDISGLSGLTNLSHLWIWSNNISNISALSGLTNLRWLEIYNNNISNISALSGLTKLWELNLDNNKVSDIKPLIDNSGLTSEDGVGLDCNPLSAISLNTYIPILQSRGVSIGYTMTTTPSAPALVSPVSSSVVYPKPKLTWNASSNASSYNIQISNTANFSSIVIDEKGLTSTLYNLGSSLATNATYYWHVNAENCVYVSGWSETWSFNTTEEEIVTFPDLGLNSAVRAGIKKSTGDIYQSDLDGLTTLSAGGRNIVDLTGLEHCTSLTSLYLDCNQISNISVLSRLTNLSSLSFDLNQISDISALSSLTNLKYLALFGNQIYNISALSGLTNLSSLYLMGNHISNISALAGLVNLNTLWLSGNWMSNINALSGLTNLISLDLSNNQISDILVLSNLTNLTNLDLSDNQISVITALAGLTNLTNLDLNSNQISDVAVLAGLTDLTNLNLYDNQISNISALAYLTNLTHLNLYDNQISDISALVGLTSLEWLPIGDNQISDISALSGLTNLQWLYLESNKISDIQPLVNNSGVDTGDYVNLASNPLSAKSVDTYIPALQSRGVTVDYTRPSGLYSDANGDDHVNATDISYIKAAILGRWGTPNPGADANGDGLITATDISYVKAYILGRWNGSARYEDTYDFSSGAGVDRWAKSNSISALPPTLSDNFDTNPGGWVGAGTADYGNMSSTDGNIWTITGTPGNYSSLQCRFTLGENPDLITSIGVTLNGSAEMNGDILQLWAWNFNTSSWRHIGGNFSMTTDITSYTAWAFWGKVYADYIDGDGYMYILANLNNTSQDMNVDYIKLSVVW